MLNFIFHALGDGYFWLGLLAGALLLYWIQQIHERADARMFAEIEQQRIRRSPGIDDKV